MRYLLLIVVAASVVSIVGCGGGQGISGPIVSTQSYTTTKQVIAADGDTLTAGGATLTVPAHSLKADTSVTLSMVDSSALPAPLAQDTTFLTAAVLLTSTAGTATLAVPATLTLTLPRAQTPGTRLTVLSYDTVATDDKVVHTGWASPVLVPVDAGGTTVTTTITKLVAYVVTPTLTVPAGKGFIFSTHEVVDAGPNDFYYSASDPGKIQPDHSPAQASSNAYVTVDKAAPGGYQLTSLTASPGNVILFKGQMPGDTNYYKIQVIEATAAGMSFIYDVIPAPGP